MEMEWFIALTLIELMKVKAALGEAFDEEAVEYRVTYAEAGETPPPEERH